MTQYCIDYSFARPDPAAIKAAGYTGVLRYVCPVNTSTRGKVITPVEAARLREAGLDLTLNFEWYETRPAKGYQAGRLDAYTADAQADTVGYPRSCAIYYSVDFAAAWGQVSEYFRGVKAASKRPVGVYGGLGIIQAARVAGYSEFGWVTNAASWSGRKNWGAVAADAKANPSQYHLLQHLHNNTPLHIKGTGDDQFDPNTIINPSYGQWRSGGQEPPALLEDNMRLIKVTDAGPQAGYVYVTNGVVKRLVPSPAARDLLVWVEAASGGAGKIVEVSQAQADTIPDYSPPVSGGGVDVTGLAAAVANELAKRLTS